jgi:DNA-binding NarL/FixJ family response regulator
METVQLTIRDARYAAALQELLERSGSLEVRRVEAPDPGQGGVMVVDWEGLDRLPSALVHPERVVLITRNDPQRLAQAWNAGIRAVVFHEDPLSTAVLAIMAAELRAAKPEPHAAGSAGPPAAAGSGQERGA